jgi:hypothetical protein
MDLQRVLFEMRCITSGDRMWLVLMFVPESCERDMVTEEGNIKYLHLKFLQHNLEKCCLEGYESTQSGRNLLMEWNNGLPQSSGWQNIAAKGRAVGID